jgi:hypothetical protein
MGFFLFATASVPALGPIQSPIQRIPGVLTPRVKRPGREANHSPSSRAHVRKAWSYISTPPTPINGVAFSQAQIQLYL